MIDSRDPKKSDAPASEMSLGILGRAAKADSESSSRANAALEAAVRERTQALEHSQQFLDSVIENIPNMVFVKDANDLRFVRFNKAGEDLLGFSRSELLGKTDYDFFPAEQADHFVSKDRQVLSGTSILDVPEETIATRAGPRILHTRKIPIIGPSGRPEYLLGISEDITEKKLTDAARLELAEARIQKEENERAVARLNFLAKASASLSSSLNFEETLKSLTNLAVPALADFCSVQLIQADGELQQLAVAHENPSKAKLAWNIDTMPARKADAGFGPKKVVRSGISELVRKVPGRKAEAASEDERARSRFLEDFRLLSYICAPIKVRGEVIGALSLATTEESGRTFSEAELRLAEELSAKAGIAVENARLYREAQRLNRVKDEFLATLSHELRSPINVIQGYADMMVDELEEMTADELRESLQTIHRNARLQTQIVGDLLDVSSIITGKIACAPQPVSPGEIALAAAHAVETTAAAKGVRLACDVSRAPSQIMADPTRLNQILWNLVNNAVKFTESGGKASVSVEQAGEYCEFKVSDTGIGISEDFLPQVFDRFRQADSSMSRKHGGLGLGLSIVRSLAEIQGGYAKAESEGLGKGSTFIVRLPLIASGSKNAPRPSAAESKGRAADKEASIAKLKILLVEDSVDNRALVSRLLRKRGAEVFEAGSALEAREILNGHSPDVIVSDIGMPGESGLDFIRRIRRDERTFAIPAVALSAYVRPDEIGEAIGAGFQAHVAKPINGEALIGEIARIAAAQAASPDQ